MGELVMSWQQAWFCGTPWTKREERLACCWCGAPNSLWRGPPALVCGEDSHLSSPSFWKRLAELSSVVLVQSELARGHKTSSRKLFFFLNKGNTFVSSKLPLASRLAPCSPFFPRSDSASTGACLAFKTLSRLARPRATQPR